MKKDLDDLIADFNLMLNGFVALTKDCSPTEQQRNRIICEWYELQNEIEKIGVKGVRANYKRR